MKRLERISETVFALNSISYLRSVTASRSRHVAAQVPLLLPLLEDGAPQRGVGLSASPS